MDHGKFVKAEMCSAAELRVWLNKNYLQRESVWLVIFKRAVPSKHVNRDEVLDQLISSGLIDGVRQQVNDLQSSGRVALGIK